MRAAIRKTVHTAGLVACLAMQTGALVGGEAPDGIRRAIETVSGEKTLAPKRLPFDSVAAD